MSKSILIRDGRGNRRKQAIVVAAPARLSEEKLARMRSGLAWSFEALDGRRRMLPPQGTSEALADYERANPFSTAMFALAERVETSRGKWEWVLPTGEVIEALIDETEEDEEPSR